MRRWCISSPLLALLFAATSLWAQQTSQSPTGSVSDAQAVAVVQAAIAALGGATAIGQIQGWTVQASLQGPIVSNSVTYSLGWDSENRYTVLSNGTKKRTRLTQSLFVPALIGPVLLSESQDSQFVMHYGGATTLDAKPVTIIRFSVTAVPDLTSQTWWFDNSTGLPKRVEFQLPAEIGSRMSFPGLIDFFDYRSFSGISYPSRFVTHFGGAAPEIITIQSVSSSSVAPSSAGFDSTAGDF